MDKPGQKLEQSPSAESCNWIGARLLRLATQSEPIADPAVVYAEEIRLLKSRRLGENEYANMAYDSGGGERSWFWENRLKETDRLIEAFTQRTHELRPTASQTARAMLLRHAFEWFERSAMSDDPEGMWNCGWRYYLGEGVSLDRSKAQLWWEKAAAKGHSPSIHRLTQK
jgi:TPR repeat protein